MILQFADISKSFGGIQALNKVNLTLENGEIRALLGGNGSGKSTLIKIASGLIHADEGTLLIDGKVVDVSSPSNSKKLGIVSTAQELSILPNLSVSDNIALCDLPKLKCGLTNKKMVREKSLEVLERLGIAKDIDVPVRSLPVNKQYLVEFAKAMYQEFDVLLIDEITSALYREDVDVVKGILEEYKASGKIIMLISHRLQEIYDICDSVTVMRNGKIIDTRNLSEATEKELLSLMIGEEYKEIKSDRNENNNKLSEETYISADDILIPKYRTHVSIRLKKGEIVGVAGLQGHGQSDIVRALHGLNGNIKLNIDRSQISIKSPIDAVKNGIAFISGDRQNEGTFRRHNLASNVSAVSSIALKLKNKSAIQALDSVNTKYSSEMQNITSLSGGNQQKVMFGRWMQVEPKLLLADDPSKGIDVQARAELRELLYALASKGTSMIIVSSDEEELASLCADENISRVIVMYEGNIVQTLKGKDVTRQNITAATLAHGGHE